MTKDILVPVVKTTIVTWKGSGRCRKQLELQAIHLDTTAGEATNRDKAYKRQCTMKT